MTGWIKMPLGMKVGLGPGDVVLDGDPAPLPKNGAVPPQFSPHVCCGQTAGWIKMALGTEVGLGPGHIVPSSLRKKEPQFSAHFYCCQTVGCVRIPLGKKVGLSLGDIVLDWDPAHPPLKGKASPIFGQCPL